MKRRLHEESLKASPGQTHFAEVELSILLACDTLNLDERGVRASVAFAALVAKDAAFRVESTRHEGSSEPVHPREAD